MANGRSGITLGVISTAVALVSIGIAVGAWKSSQEHSAESLSSRIASLEERRAAVEELPPPTATVSTEYEAKGEMTQDLGQHDFCFFTHTNETRDLEYGSGCSLVRGAEGTWSLTANKADCRARCVDYR